MKLFKDSSVANTIIERQLKRWEAEKAMADKEPLEGSTLKAIITVSRAFGAQGEEVATRLARLTGFQLLDKEIMEAIAKDVGVQSKMVEVLDENAQTELEAWINGILGKNVIDSSDYFKSLTKTVGHFMRHGEAVMVGRGTNIILGPKRGYHVRITASKYTRAGNIAKLQGTSHEEATKLVEEKDVQRTKFIKKTYGVDIDDPSLYDLVINMDNLTVDDAVELALLGFGKKKKNLFA